MGVGCSSLVVTRENGFERGNTVFIGDLDTTKIGGIPAISGIVAALADATVLG